MYFKILPLLTIFLTLGCSTTPRKAKNLPQRLVTPHSLRLSLQPLQGRIETTSYYFHAHIQQYNKDVLEEKKDETASFDIETETILVDRGQAKLHLNVKTTRKEGDIDLNDMAFPELGQSLRLVLYPNGEVANADGYPKTSIFYIPPISLPNRKVKVGDTWKLSRRWVSEQGQPLHVDMVTIFKSLYSCGEKDKCADMEIFGNVKLIGVNKALKFKNSIQGRILFSLGRGTVVWSLVRSQESFSYRKNKTTVHSCLTSHLIAPEKSLWPMPEKTYCDPHNTNSVSLVGL